MTDEQLYALAAFQLYCIWNWKTLRLIEQLDTGDDKCLGLCDIEAATRVEQYWLGIGSAVDPGLAEWDRLFQRSGSAGIVTVLVPQDIVQDARETAAPDTPHTVILILEGWKDGA